MNDRGHWKLISRRVTALMLVTICVLTPRASRADESAGRDFDPVRREISSGPVTLTVELNRRTSLVAEPIELSLQFEAPPDTLVRFMQIDENLGPFEVIATNEWKSLPIGDDSPRRQWILGITIESLRPGSKVVPPVSIQYQLPGGDGEWQSLVSRPIEISIESVTAADADPMEFRDIKGTAEIALPKTTSGRRVAAVVVAISAVGLAFVALIVRIRRGRKHSPADWAVKEIAAVRAESKGRSTADRKLYGDLIHILRTYVQGRFEIEAHTLSGDELIQSLREQPQLRDAEVDPLVALVDASNRARFSGVDPGSDIDASNAPTTGTLNDMIDVLQRFIEATRSESIGFRR